MSEEKFLRYTVNKDEYVFFYGEEILFINSKSNPFLYVTLEKEEVKRELPLCYCDITKISTYGYKIKFYNKEYAVNLKIDIVKNTIFFEFTKLGLFGELLNINLYRKNSKIKGMGLNTIKDVYNVSCDKKGFAKYKNYCDVKPSFSIKNGYFFKNIDIEDYQIYFYGNFVRIQTRQNEGSFLLEFDRKYYFGDTERNILCFCSEKEARKIIGKDTDFTGFITPYKKTDCFLSFSQYIRKNRYKHFVYVDPFVKKDDDSFNKYDQNGLIPYRNFYLIDEKNETNVRLFNNKIRDIFDKNVDGIYLNEMIDYSLILNNSKKPYIGEKLHQSLYHIIKEYPNKLIIYNKLHLSEKKCEVFSVFYNLIKKKEEDYQKALTYSAIDNVFYECSSAEYKQIKDKKMQIIVRK